MPRQLIDRIYRGLETKLGAMQIHAAAVSGAAGKTPRKGWTQPLDHVRHHVQIIRDTMATLGLDPDEETTEARPNWEAFGALGMRFKH